MSYSRFDRMLAIPEDEFYQLKSLQLTNDPAQNKFLSLSNDYRRQASIVNPHTRVQRQGETLNQMINVKDDIRERLISATPKPYQSRAQSLFQFIANKLKMNEKGELINDDGSVLDGSNITDLIQHSVRDRRRNITPVGWSTFVKTMKEANVPRMILNYETLDEMSSSKQANKKSLIPVPIIQKTNIKQTSKPSLSLAKPTSTNLSRRKSASGRKLTPPKYLKSYITGSPPISPEKKRKKKK